jgi:hypothetical protein
VLRDFNSHTAWHPIVGKSAIEGGEPADQVGCVRNFTLKDGNHIREQLLALSDEDHVSTYCILDATLPMQRYVATVQLKRVTDGNRTFWHWQSTSTSPGRERELAELVGTASTRAASKGCAPTCRRGTPIRGGRASGRARRGDPGHHGVVVGTVRRPGGAPPSGSAGGPGRARCGSGRRPSASTTSTSTCARGSTG